VEQTPATTQTAAPTQPDATSKPNDPPAPNDAGALNDAPRASEEPAGTSESAGTSEQSPSAIAAEPTPSGPPGFGARGRVRRRARFLRKARELAYRDLGGLVFSLHHFGQRNDTLVLAKLATLSRIDAELRALEASLSERQPLTVLREAGITACPRCAAIHSGEDRFCPNCGLPMSRKSDLPIAGAAASVAPAGSPGVVAPGALAPATTPAAGSPPAAASPHGATAPTVATSTPATSTPASPAPDPTAPVAAPPASSQPTAQPPSAPASASGDEQPTEIIRPPASGS
jgi:hypothetical protein